MAMTTIYLIASDPTLYLTEDRAQMTLRPMAPEDKDDLLDFFSVASPPEDRFALKEDVTDAKILDRLALTLDYRRVVPLLAILDGKIIGDGTRHHRRAGARQPIGEVWVVVDPDYRNRGVGKGLLHQLVALAGDKGLTKLMFEVVADTEETACHTAQRLGFIPVATLAGHVLDSGGKAHDLIIMERQLLGSEVSANGEDKPYCRSFKAGKAGNAAVEAVTRCLKG